jgi:hypothetical protein
MTKDLWTTRLCMKRTAKKCYPCCQVLREGSSTFLYSYSPHSIVPSGGMSFDRDEYADSDQT